MPLRTTPPPTRFTKCTKMRSLSVIYKNRIDVERLIGLQEDVIFYDRKYSHALINLETIENAYNDATFLHYSLEFFPENGTLCLKEVYEGENDNRFVFSYFGYAENAEDIKSLFERERAAVENGERQGDFISAASY